MMEHFLIWLHSLSVLQTVLFLIGVALLSAWIPCLMFPAENPKRFKEFVLGEQWEPTMEENRQRVLVLVWAAKPWRRELQ